MRTNSKVYNQIKTQMNTFFLNNKNKYSNKRVEVKGHSFASKMEAQRYQELLLLEQANLIEIVATQETVYLTDARIIYKPDFTVKDKMTQKIHWEETKGFETESWRIKRRLWLHYGPGTLKIFKGTARGLFLHEELIPKK